MFLLFGTRTRETQLAVVRFVCHYCGVDAPQRVFRWATRLTLFFLLPVLPLGSRYAVRCDHCGGLTSLTRQQARNGEAWAAARA